MSDGRVANVANINEQLIRDKALNIKNKATDTKNTFYISD